MAAGERLTIQLSGPSPWGFRLFGGEDEPLEVAKLRKRSKADQCGLKEGDILLSINSKICRGMTHHDAMNYIDTSQMSLTLDVLRGSNDKNEINTAYDTVVKQLIHPAAKSQENGGKTTSVTQQTFQTDDTTRDIKTSVTTQQFGGTQITRVRREETVQTGPSYSQYGQAPMWESSQPSWRPQQQPQPAPYHHPAPQMQPKPGVWSPRPQQPARPQFQQPRPVFQPSSTTNRPGVWQPSSGLSVRAPSNVQVHQNDDRSITMSIGLGMSQADGKENMAPSTKPSMFKVNKVGLTKPPNTWQPPIGSGYPQPVQEIHHHKPIMNGENEANDFYNEQEAPVHEQHPKHPPVFAPSVMTSIEGPEHPPSSPDDQGQKPLTLDLSGVGHDSTGGYGSGEGPSTPLSDGSGSRKKKLFADSAFYEDAGHTYPTIDEQMKMAKVVALSLTSPANEAARGHQMFIKRKRKAEKWTTQSGGTGEKSSSGGDLANIGDFDEFDDPNRPLFSFRIPKLALRELIPPQLAPKPPPAPPIEGLIDKQKLNLQDFENLRLKGQKNLHMNIAPEICFSIADALHQTKGRGGKIFAKRRAKSEKWVIDENNVRLAPPPPPKPQPQQQGMPSNRLKELLNPPKASMTPWEAAVEHYGNVEPAFSHLHGYDPRGKTTGTEVAHKVHEAAARSKGPPSWMNKKGPAPPPVQPKPQMPSGNFRDFNKKIRGWSNTGNQTPSSTRSSTPDSGTGMPATGKYSTLPRGWRQGSSINEEPSQPWQSHPAANLPQSHYQSTGYRKVTVPNERTGVFNVNMTTSYGHGAGGSFSPQSFVQTVGGESDL